MKNKIKRIRREKATNRKEMKGEQKIRENIRKREKDMEKEQ